MARQLPASIKKTPKSKFVFLVEISLSSGTEYYSSGQSVDYNGNTYKTNKMFKYDTNLQEIVSGAFPEDDRLIQVHLHDIDTGITLDLVWRGFTGRQHVFYRTKLAS